jgi:hypothetical protein
MNVLEKILEEIEDHAIEFESFGMCDDYVSVGWAKDIIRSHMGDVPKCRECSRRKWYQKGYEDGKKDNGWIPYTLQNIPKKEGVYLVTCDDEEYPVKRMRFKKEDEYGLWYDDYGIYDGVIFAWQPLPKPYKEG